MQESPTEPVPVRTAIEDVASTGRTLLLKRIDLLQLEVERMVDDAATRLSGAVGAVMLTAVAMLTGSVAAIAALEPAFGLAGAAGFVTLGLTVLAIVAGLIARRKHARIGDEEAL